MLYEQAFFARKPRIIVIPYRPVLPEGIHLVKRKGALSAGYDHYGFAISGKYLKNFDLHGSNPRVLHRIYESTTKVEISNYDPLEWQTLYRVPENEIPLTVLRAYVSRNDKYNLLFDNCEHFARFVTTGKKESSQVQNAVGWTVLLSIAYLWLKDDN